MVGGCGQDGHESEAGAQEDPASDVKEAVVTSPRPGPGAYHVATISRGPIHETNLLSLAKQTFCQKINLVPGSSPAPRATRDLFSHSQLS